LAAVPDAVKDANQLAFYNAVDYGAVFYWRQRIPVVSTSMVELSRSGRIRYLLL
jgi:hypothetical protein